MLKMTTISSVPFLHSYLSFLPAFLSASLPSLLPSFLPAFFLSFICDSLPSFPLSYGKFPSYHSSFLPIVLLSFLPNIHSFSIFLSYLPFGQWPMRQLGILAVIFFSPPFCSSSNTSFASLMARQFLICLTSKTDLSNGIH